MTWKGPALTASRALVRLGLDAEAVRLTEAPDATCAYQRAHEGMVVACAVFRAAMRRGDRALADVALSAQRECAHAADAARDTWTEVA